MDYKKLSDLCDVVSGGTPARSRIECWENGTIPWVKISDLSSKYIKGTEEKITETGLKESSAKLLPRGTILFSIFATLGATGILDIDASTNQAIAGLTVRDSRTIDPEYIYYYLLSKKTYVNNIGRGVAQNNINLSILKSLEVPVPTVDEQRSIIAILNKNDAIITGKRKVLKALNELVKARFVEMFGDFKINPMGWPVVGFEEIAIIDGNMTTDYEKYADYPHIGIDSIEKESGLLKGYRTVAEDGVISAKYVFTPAHIIYSKIRPNLNKVALPDFDGLCSADAYPILPIEGKCNRVFLAYDMRSQFFLDYILQFCNRTNLPKVNRKEVTGFRTPLPPIELQNEFASFVAQVDKSKAAVQKSLDETQLLFDSLMQKYFG